LKLHLKLNNLFLVKIYRDVRDVLLFASGVAREKAKHRLTEPLPRLWASLNSKEPTPGSEGDPRMARYGYRDGRDLCSGGSAESWGASPRLKGVARSGYGTPCVPPQLTGNCQHSAVNNKGEHKGERAQRFRPSVGDKKGRERERFREEEGKMSSL
jgi:hypothetical protein